MTTLQKTLQDCITAMEAALSDDQPYIDRCKAAITQAKQALDHVPDAGKMVQPLGWYVIDKDGLVTQCADKEDAKSVAAACFVRYPRNSPYRAVQLCEYVQPQAKQTLDMGASPLPQNVKCQQPQAQGEAVAEWNDENVIAYCIARGIKAAHPQASEPAPKKCWMCGDMDAAFQSKCDVPTCEMRETAITQASEPALKDDPLQGAVDWLLQPNNREFKRLVDRARERAAAPEAKK